MTSHPTCSTGPYWNTEMCDRTVDKYSEAKTPSSWTTGGSCSIFPQLSVLEALLRPSYLSLQITECHTYPAPFYTTAPIPHAPNIAWQMEDVSTHGTSPCPQKYAPTTALGRLCSLRYRMWLLLSCELSHLGLISASSIESLVMPVTNLYFRRNWRLLFGVGIRSW